MQVNNVVLPLPNTVLVTNACQGQVRGKDKFNQCSVKCGVMGMKVLRNGDETILPKGCVTVKSSMKCNR